MKQQLVFFILWVFSGFYCLGQSPEKLTLEVNQGVKSLQWQSQQGRAYFLQFSTDLESWQYFPTVIEPGDGQQKEWMFSTAEPKMFSRLRSYSSTSMTPEIEDFDGDGYTNYFELRFANSDPLDVSTPGMSLDIDGDGLSDEFEIEHFGSLQFNASDDNDGDGVSNLDEWINGTNPNANDQVPGPGGPLGGGDPHTGVTVLPTNVGIIDHESDGDEDVKTELSQTLNWTKGASSFFAVVGIYTQEYPTYTDPTCTTTDENGNEVPCDFNDIVTYDLNSPLSGVRLMASHDVNDLDAQFDNPLLSKNFDLGAGEKYYYFAEKKVIPNRFRSTVPMFAKVESTEIGDGSLPSGATIAVFPVQIKPKATSAGQVGDLIMSQLGIFGEKHFVSTKKNAHLNNDFIEFEVSGISKTIFDEFLEWQGGVAGNETTERKVSRANSAKTQLKIKVKGTGETVDLMNVWTAWADISGQVTPINVQPSPLRSGGTGGTSISGIYNGTFTITPASIITDTDKPNLTGQNATPTPGGVTISGNLGMGATHKWDVSRRIKRVMNINATPALNTSSLDVNINFPADKLVGNDDAVNNFKQDTNPYPARGTLMSFDEPNRFFEFQGGGAASTYDNDTDFQEFARLEINGKWYLLSADDTWGIHWKFKKEVVTEASFNSDLNQDGDKLDDVHEDSPLLNNDLDGDGTIGGVVTRWIDNSSDTNN